MVFAHNQKQVTFAKQVDSGLFRRSLVESGPQGIGHKETLVSAYVSSQRGVVFPIAEFWDLTKTSKQTVVYFETESGNIYRIHGPVDGDFRILTDSKKGRAFILNRDGAKNLTLEIGKRFLVPGKRETTAVANIAVIQLSETFWPGTPDKEFGGIVRGFHENLAKASNVSFESQVVMGFFRGIWIDTDSTYLKGAMRFAFASEREGAVFPITEFSDQTMAMTNMNIDMMGSNFIRRIYIRTASGNIYLIRPGPESGPDGRSTTISIVSSKNGESTVLDRERAENLHLEVGMSFRLPGRSITTEITSIVAETGVLLLSDQDARRIGVEFDEKLENAKR
jgi:hypothetical protein